MLWRRTTRHHMQPSSHFWWPILRKTSVICSEILRWDMLATLLRTQCRACFVIICLRITELPAYSQALYVVVCSKHVMYTFRNNAVVLILLLLVVSLSYLPLWYKKFITAPKPFVLWRQKHYGLGWWYLSQTAWLLYHVCISFFAAIFCVLEWITSTSRLVPLHATALPESELVADANLFYSHAAMLTCHAIWCQHGKRSAVLFCGLQHAKALGSYSGDTGSIPMWT